MENGYFFYICMDETLPPLLLLLPKIFLSDTNIAVFSRNCLITVEHLKTDMLYQFGAEISAPKRHPACACICCVCVCVYVVCVGCELPSVAV